MPKVNVGTIGHIDHGKTTLSAAIAVVLADSCHMYDRLEVPTERKFKPETGQMIAPCTIARVGIMQYRAGDCVGIKDGKPYELFPDKDPDEMVKVKTSAEELFSDKTMESARSAPITVNHPRDADGNLMDVTADNSKDLQKGSLEGLPTRMGDELSATIVLNDQATITLVQETADDLSIGQTCNLRLADEGCDWDAEKIDIRINHVAVVRKGRAGTSRIGDSVNMYDQDHVDGLQATVDAQKVKLADTSSKLEVAEAALADAKEELKTAKDVAFNDAVESRIVLITNARLLDSKIETKGKTEAEIKLAAVSKSFSGTVVLADQSDAYVAVLFDMAIADHQEDNGLSDVQIALNDEADKVVVKKNTPKVVSPTEAARQRAIKRNEHKD